MFDLVKTAPQADAVHAVYEATLRLSQRERLAWIKETSAFPVTENQLAAKLLLEIEQAEARDLAELSKEETDRYIVEISAVLEERRRKESPIDEERGKALLEEMQAEYERRYPARAS